MIPTRHYILTMSLVASQAPTESVSHAKVQDDNREAVVRFQMRNSQHSARVYFVRISSEDPPPNFLTRFADSKKQIKKRSDARVDGSNLVVDKRSRAHGVILNQGDIRRITESVVEVEGGYSCGSLCGASGVYHLRRDGESWTVTHFRASRIY
jgi:hypothetical protein